jgi:hypothetical protein
MVMVLESNGYGVQEEWKAHRLGVECLSASAILILSRTLIPSTNPCMALVAVLVLASNGHRA